ncbi:kinase-like domain-containing protein [Mycena capillaripes]|nr:kinase-like domain-containing protein [Mycena capillaripes]
MRDVPGFPRLYGAFEDGENRYLVMECASKSFANVGVLTMEQIRFYAAQLIIQIHALHVRGIIHRDVKEANLLLGHDGNLILADFGIAADLTTVRERINPAEYIDWEEARQEGGDEFPLLWAYAENPESIRGSMGTVGYMPPEAVNNSWFSYGVDYWSLGVVVYHWLIDICHEGNLSTEDETVTMDFLQAVMAPEQEDRLELDEMKDHEFFQGIDFDELQKGNVAVPRR